MYIDIWILWGGGVEAQLQIGSLRTFSNLGTTKQIIILVAYLYIYVYFGGSGSSAPNWVPQNILEPDQNKYTISSVIMGSLDK